MSSINSSAVSALSGLLTLPDVCMAGAGAGPHSGVAYGFRIAVPAGSPGIGDAASPEASLGAQEETHAVDVVSDSEEPQAGEASSVKDLFKIPGPQAATEKFGASGAFRESEELLAGFSGLQLSAASTPVPAVTSADARRARELEPPEFSLGAGALPLSPEETEFAVKTLYCLSALLETSSRKEGSAEMPLIFAMGALNPRRSKKTEKGSRAKPKSKSKSKPRPKPVFVGLMAERLIYGGEAGAKNAHKTFRCPPAEADAEAKWVSIGCGRLLQKHRGTDIPSVKNMSDMNGVLKASESSLLS